MIQLIKRDSFPKESPTKVSKGTSVLPQLRQRTSSFGCKNRIMRRQSVAQSDTDAITKRSIRFTSFVPYTEHRDINETPRFDYNRTNDFVKIFVLKCQEAKKVCVFGKTPRSEIQKKTVVLEELLEAFQFPNVMRKMTAECVEAAVDAVGANLFRDFPQITSLPCFILIDRVENFCDDAWEHLDHIYSLLTSILTASHIHLSIIAPSITTPFCRNLFHLFSSPDSRERQFLKNIFYTISCRIPDKCSIIISLIQSALVEALHDEPIQWGLPQLLELFFMMSQTVPQVISQTFDSMLPSVFLPLHLKSNCPSFHPLLWRCTNIFLIKDKYYAETLMHFLLNHFPITSQIKQNFFLEEIIDIVKNFYQFFIPASILKLFARITDLFQSQCAVIAEKSLSAMFQDGFHQLIRQNYSKLAPMIIYKASKVAKNHWDEVITYNAFAVLQEMSKMEASSFIRINNNITDMDTIVRKMETDREEYWKSLKEGRMPLLPSPLYFETKNSSSNSDLLAPKNKLLSLPKSKRVTASVGRFHK